MSAVPPAERLPFRVKVGHGIGSAAYGVKDNGFSTLLLLFYNQVMGLDPGLVGLVLLVALFLDAIVDPFVGHFVDKTYTHWGKRHPWMYAAIVPMAFCWTLLWFPPSSLGTGLYVYLLVIAFLMRASVSCYEVPALTVVPALSADYDERTSITRWRFLSAWGGGLLMLILAFAVFLVPEPGYPVGQLNINGYHKYGLAGAAIILAVTLTSTLTTHKRLARLSAEKPRKLALRATLSHIGETLSNRAYLIILGSTLLTYTNTGVAFSSAAYMLTFLWEMPQTCFLAYSATLFVGVVAAFLLVGFVQSRIEKHVGAAVFGSISLLFAIMPYGLRLFGLFPENGSATLIPVLFLVITLANAFSVASMMLGQSMAADVVEAAQERSGQRTEGLFFAGLFFVQKFATGAGIFLTGLILSLAQFPKNAAPGQVALPVLDMLMVLQIAVLVCLGGTSIYLIAQFPIRRADHEARVRRLAQQTQFSGN
ncbi:MAG: MFS transporter [Sphingomonadales bacterium]|nr:MFS transporter [Sphingomonadales bacterium]